MAVIEGIQWCKNIQNSLVYENFGWRFKIV